MNSVYKDILLAVHSFKWFPLVLYNWMLLNNIHLVTRMLAEIKKHCKVRVQTINLLFPEKMLFVKQEQILSP